MLLTRSPLSVYLRCPKTVSLYTPFDLHVLSAPPAFVLSQDQTLNQSCISPYLYGYIPKRSLRSFRRLSTASCVSAVLPSGSPLLLKKGSFKLLLSDFQGPARALLSLGPAVPGPKRGIIFYHPSPPTVNPPPYLFLPLPRVCCER